SDGAVAKACEASPELPARGARQALVYVIPAGRDAPVARAPFALVRPDGLIRHGVSDRRGAGLEIDLPPGSLSLGVPTARGERSALPFPVAVELAPADAPREHVAVLRAACTRTKREVECVAAEEVDDRGASAVAIVTWQSEQRALVEVGLRRGGQPEWR